MSLENMYCECSNIGNQAYLSILLCQVPCESSLLYTTLTELFVIHMKPHTVFTQSWYFFFLDMAIGPKVSKRSTLSQNHFQPQFYKWLMFILEFSRTE